MLKNILSLLLSKFYSKKESELVGHQAMPSSQSISITPTVNSVGDEAATVATFNAQADGFVIVRATTDGAPASRLILFSYVSTYIVNKSAGGTIATFIPIAKGIQCTVQGRNLKNIVISLYKTIGGGSKLVKNALLQGGGLCLKHLYSSLRRSSLSVKRSGSVIKPCRAIAYNSTTRSLCTLHRVMDGLVFTEIQLRTWILLFCPAARLLQDLQLHKAIVTTKQASLFQSQRGRNFRLFLLKVSQKFGSHQLTDPQINLAEGGASC